MSICGFTTIGIDMAAKKLPSVSTMLALLLFLLLSSPLPLEGSLLPVFDRRSSGPLAERHHVDPFRILEHLPFPFDPNDPFPVSPPRVDWKETPDFHHIMIDVPGLKQEELKIELEENRVLRVSGERKREEERKGEHWHCVERAYDKFWRQFRLPENADIESVAAKLDHGVLTVSAKKLSSEMVRKPKEVKVISVKEAARECVRTCDSSVSGLN